MLKKLLILPIRFYQYFLSPWIGQSCRFTQSSSNYMYEAIEIHGAFKGLWLGSNSICRSNAIFKGGHDPVPPKKPR